MLFRSPFATPPVGLLRWKAPESAPEDDRIFEAVYNGKSPLQTEWETERASYYPQSEDCLYLNIWMGSPEAYGEKRAVMVFFHGGAYGWGGTADPIYNGLNFARAHPEVVLITAAYRTGIMGFIDLSYVQGGEDFPDAPNLGLLDHIEALKWVKRNCRAFGGDPDNITIFGESAGGGTVSILPFIPRAKGLFKRAIAQSGSVALTYSKEQCKSFTMKLLEASKVRTMDELMQLSEAQLIELNEDLNQFNNFPQRDGRLIPEDPYMPYRNGLTKDVDMIIGTNENEMNYWIGEIGGLVPFRFSIPVKFENDLKLLNRRDRIRIHEFMTTRKERSYWRMSEFYTEMMFRLPAVCQAGEHAENGGRAYMYLWTVPSAKPYYKACHAVELAYVFGNIDDTIYTGRPADRAVSSMVQQMWVNFAKTGDPSVEGLKWPRYDKKHRRTMIISKEPRVKEDPESKNRRLLYPLLRHMINPSYNDLDLKVPFVFATIGLAGAVCAAGLSLLIAHIRKRH